MANMKRRPLTPLPVITNQTQLPYPSNQELDAAVARWNAYCPPFFVGLLEADIETDKTSKSKFVRSADGLRIYLRRGMKRIPRREIMRAYIAYSRKAAGL